MRKALNDAVKKAMCIECRLPHSESGVDKSCLSTNNDICFKNGNPQDLSKAIYNGIVEFAVNEYEIDYDKLDLEQRKVIQRRIRYNPDATSATKIKYGFYGEVLIDLIMRCFLNTNVILARGYLYSPIENSEVKGFDAFHLVESNGKLDLWLGEAKFYVAYKKPITDVLEKLDKSLSDAYVHKNLLALIDWQDRFTSSSTQLTDLLDSWEENPEINLAEEMKKYNIRLTYPILIAYQQGSTHEFHESIGKCIEHICDEFKRLNISIPASFDYRLFFIFLPLSDVKNIKETVVQWIDTKEPLI